MSASALISGSTEFAGGASIPIHFHNSKESELLVEGHTIFGINGEAFDFQLQGIIFIPAGVPHWFRNASDTETNKIMWIYGLPYSTRTLEEHGEKQPIAADMLPRCMRIIFVVYAIEGLSAEQKKTLIVRITRAVVDICCPTFLRCAAGMPINPSSAVSFDDVVAS